MEFQALRQEYMAHELSENDLPLNPVEQLASWLDDAVDAQVDEPNAMCLATVNANGFPTTRTVLLKALSADGLTFFTNYQSRKADHIESNPNVSVNFLWLALQRQINVSGTVERISKTETMEYFVKRPFASQLGAWSSPQSQVISSRQVLELNWLEMKRRFKRGKVALPTHWGGYRIVPSSFEFWQGRENRLHDRFEYTINDSGEWDCHRLAP